MTDHLPQHDAEAVERVLARTAKITGIRRDLLLGAGRPARVARARQLAMTAIRRRSVLTLMDIGGVFARDHTTVIAARKRITRLVRIDPDLDHALRTIESAWSEDITSLPPMPMPAPA